MGKTYTVKVKPEDVRQPRKTWGQINPVERIHSKPNAYKRIKKDWKNEREAD